MAGVDSVSSMLDELSGGLSKGFPPFPAMGQVTRSYLDCQTWSVAHRSGSEGSLMFEAVPPLLSRTEHATISAVPTRHASFQAPMNQSNFWDQQRGSQSERDFISASSPSQMAVRSHTMIEQAGIQERQQQRSQTEQASIPMAFLSHGAAQSHVMIDQATLQDQQQSLANQGHVHRDAFEEFVLFDMPKPAQIHGAELSQRGRDFQDPMQYHQPKSQTDQPSSSCGYVELKQRSKTDPRHASSLAGDASPSLSNLNSNHSNIHSSMSGTLADSMHPNFNERIVPGPLVSPHTQTDPAHLTCPDSVLRGLPRIEVPRSPTVPEGALYQYQVDAPRYQARSQTGTDTVSNMRQMQPRGPGQPAHSEFQNRAGMNLPTSQTGSIAEKVPVILPRSYTHKPFSSPYDSAGPDLQASPNAQLILPRSLTDSAYSSLPNNVQMSSGSDNVPLDGPRRLSDQALPLQDQLPLQVQSPSIESIIAMSHQLLRQAEGMREKSMAHQQACAGPASAEPPLVLKTVIDDKADLETQESESENSGSDYDVLVGPTELVSANLGLCNLALPTGSGKSKNLVPLISRPHMVAVSDGIRLAKAQSFEKPLSFGSTLHLMGGALELCRPCMFEQRPGRCKKSYCCDFCHVGPHRSQARKAKNAAVAKMQSRGKRGKFATT